MFNALRLTDKIMRKKRVAGRQSLGSNPSFPSAPPTCTTSDKPTPAVPQLVCDPMAAEHEAPDPEACGRQDTLGLPSSCILEFAVFEYFCLFFLIEFM